MYWYAFVPFNRKCAPVVRGCKTRTKRGITVPLNITIYSTSTSSIIRSLQIGLSTKPSIPQTTWYVFFFFFFFCLEHPCHSIPDRRCGGSSDSGDSGGGGGVQTTLHDYAGPSMTRGEQVLLSANAPLINHSSITHQSLINHSSISPRWPRERTGADDELGERGAWRGALPGTARSLPGNGAES